MENNKDTKIHNENHMENCNVFNGPIYGASFPLPGANVTINQYYGKEQKVASHVKEGNAETADDRKKRKSEVIKAITSMFNFGNSNLGKDRKHNKITNERLGILFRKCFGDGSYPSNESLAIIEQLWVLLIDERKQCHKESGEDFYRQTVLNIFGYFHKHGIVVGLPREIAQCIFKDADTNISKNISRGIETNAFPKDAYKVFDLYINKLMEGEF